MSRKKLLHWTAGAVVLAAFSANEAFAQVDEIIVEAERRRESIQDVPIAVSAFRAEDLEAKQISKPIDLINYVPNVYGSNNTGLGTAVAYYIRGLGNTESIATFDPPVGTYVDEVYIARQNGNNVSFFDVEQMTIVGREKLPDGRSTLRYAFESEGGIGAGGRGRLYVGDRLVGEGRIGRTVPRFFSIDETFDVGIDTGSPAGDYPPGFPFGGRIHAVEITLAPVAAK